MYCEPPHSWATVWRTPAARCSRSPISPHTSRSGMPSARISPQMRKNLKAGLPSRRPMAAVRLSTTSLHASNIAVEGTAGRWREQVSKSAEFRKIPPAISAPHVSQLPPAAAGTRSSAHTLNVFRTCGPKVLISGTSVASRPRATTMRPMRGLLWRASNVYQRLSRYTSTQALKSMGAGSFGTPMSPRYPLT